MRAASARWCLGGGGAASKAGPGPSAIQAGVRAGAALAILGGRAAQRYDADAARSYFQRAIAAARPQERMQIRRMADASLAEPSQQMTSCSSPATSTPKATTMPRRTPGSSLTDHSMSLG